MEYKEIVEYLYSKGFFSVKLGLERVKALYERVGRPCSDLDIIHVAGTNGKGSTCSFIKSALLANGYKVGLFTSPHLIDFRERIMISGNKISEETFIRAFQSVEKHIQDESFFEIMTILALKCFEIEDLDFVILEVGMGGRLDATNIVTPILSVITDISLEHTEHLGNTIDKIAYEKAGIIKEGVDVIISPENKGMNVFRKVGSERSAFLHEADLLDIEINSKGEYQKYNVSTAHKALLVLESKGVGLNKEKTLLGLKSMKWPGRLDFISERIVLDCAHNPNGAKTFVEELFSLGHKDVVLVLGIMKNKDIKTMCQEFDKISKEIIVCKPMIERSALPDDIVKFLSEKTIIKNNVCDAIEYAKSIAGDRLIAITGSIFTVGEAFSCLGVDPFDR